MPPSLRPSPPPSKEPPDKQNIPLPLPGASRAVDSSIAMPPAQTQPPASPTTRPPFSPFFTLIHDTATSTTYHPRNVHYIFSDDDPSLLTTACLSALSLQHASPTNPPYNQRAANPSSLSSSSSGGTGSKSLSTSTTATTTTAAPPPHSKREVPEDRRVLLLDLDDSGTAVSKAHSLSSSWQIISTSLTPAPTWEESPSPSAAEASGEQGSGAGFMLKISGTDARQVRNSSGGGAIIGTGLGLGGGGGGVGIAGRGESKNTAAAAAAAGGLTEADFQALMREFDARMKVLRTVVETGVEVGLRHDSRAAIEPEDPVDKGEETVGQEI